MKKVLVTWYGITDLNSSFQSHLGDGPILGALKAEEYSIVLILGYTNPEKVNLNITSFEIEKQEVQKEFKKAKDSNLISSLLYKYANTEFAHKNYVSWLIKQLTSDSIESKVSFRQVELTHLNDTEGIYSNAITALDNILSQEPDVELRLYLSPGTPVMAFVWAFVSMRYPTTKIKLLVSSKPGCPPEKISLPMEWLDWHGNQINSDSNYDSFDVVFHLQGEQKMPCLLGIRQFDCKEHVFINTKKYPADGLKLFVDEGGFLEINIDPYDPEDVRVKIINEVFKRSNATRIGFNLTGGTKLMYAGALAACRKVNGVSFYFDSANKQVVYLDNFKKRSAIREIDNIETYFKLNSNYLKISNFGNDPINNDRLDLTKILWENRSYISKFYKEISNYNDKPAVPFEIMKGEVYIKLTKDNIARITIKKHTFEIFDFADFASYLSGGWFEEYVYYRLQKYVDSGKIKDIRINFEVSYNEKVSRINSNAYQEFDVVFTDGDRLYIVECKAGSIKSEYVRKLESITRDYGGSTAVGILASCFKPNNKVISKKAELSPNVILFAGNKLFEEFDKLLV